MALERLFNELDSREFIIVIDGKKYRISHLNQLKSVLKDLAVKAETSRLSENELIFTLFDAAGDKAFQKAWRTLSLREVKKIHKAWHEWSGFAPEKSFRHGKR